MQIRKILGRVVRGHISNSIVKLENGRYAVGHLTLGQTVEMENQFETFDAAFEHWLTEQTPRDLAPLPAHGFPLGCRPGFN